MRFPKVGGVAGELPRGIYPGMGGLVTVVVPFPKVAVPPKAPAPWPLQETASGVAPRPPPAKAGAPTMATTSHRPHAHYNQLLRPKGDINRGIRAPLQLQQQDPRWRGQQPAVAGTVATDGDADPNADITVAGSTPILQPMDTNLHRHFNPFAKPMSKSNFHAIHFHHMTAKKAVNRRPATLDHFWLRETRFLLTGDFNMAINWDQVPVPFHVSGAGLAPQPPPAKAARGT